MSSTPPLENRRAPRNVLLSALADAARDQSSYFHLLPSLGPLQIIEQCVRRATFPVGVVSSSGRMLRTVGSPGSSALGQFNNPCFITGVPDRDELIVTDVRRLLFISTVDWSFKPAFSASGSGISYAAAIAVDCQHNIVIADPNNHRVVALTYDGSFVRSFGNTSGSDNEPLNSPCGIAVTSRGEYVVSDEGTHRVQVFGADGSFVRAFGSQGSGNALFDMPRGVCVNGDDDIVVTDKGNARVQIFRSDGTFVRTFGSQGCADGQFNRAMCVAVDGDGKIVVSDFSRHRVQVFRGDGMFVRTFGSQGSGERQFSFPFGVAILADGCIAVCDMGNCRLQVWS